MSLTFPTDFHSNCSFLSTGIRCYQSFALFNSRKWKIKYSTHFDIHNMSAHMRRSIATTMVKKNPKRSDQYWMKKSWKLFWPSPSVYTDGVDSMYKQYMNRILILIFIPMVSIVFILMTEPSELMFDLWSIVNTIDISTVIRGKDAIKSNLIAVQCLLFDDQTCSLSTVSSRTSLTDIRWESTPSYHMLKLPSIITITHMCSTYEWQYVNVE